MGRVHLQISYLLLGIVFLGFWSKLLGQGDSVILKEGDIAPDFALQDQDGKTHRLSQYLGQYVVLYFYPKDQTPGCTMEACSFRDSYQRFQGKGIIVLGVSTDNVASHKAFKENYQLPFSLLADTTKEVCRKYGVLSALGWANRQTFIIGPDGKIVKIYRKVNPKIHADEVFQLLTAVSKE